MRIVIKALSGHANDQASLSHQLAVRRRRLSSQPFSRCLALANRVRQPTYTALRSPTTERAPLVFLFFFFSLRPFEPTTRPARKKQQKINIPCGDPFRYKGTCACPWASRLFVESFLPLSPSLPPPPPLHAIQKSRASPNPRLIAAAHRHSCRLFLAFSRPQLLSPMAASWSLLVRPAVAHAAIPLPAPVERLSRRCVRRVYGKLHHPSQRPRAGIH